MLNWIKDQWFHLVLWWNRGKIAKAHLERAFVEAETMGCRDSAETLVLNCLQIWERFGWWSYEASTAVVKLNNAMYAVLGDRDRAAMVALGAVSHALKVGQNPKDFLPRASDVLAMIAAQGLDQKVRDEGRMHLMELFPSIAWDLRFRDDGPPTAERVLIWVARE